MAKPAPKIGVPYTTFTGRGATPDQYRDAVALVQDECRRRTDTGGRPIRTALDQAVEIAFADMLQRVAGGAHECVACGARYKQNKCKTRRYCSQRCAKMFRRAWRRVMGLCTECGGPTPDGRVTCGCGVAA